MAPVGIDGPQWVLEYWSDINNVFQFVRVEDIAYDKRPGDGRRRSSWTPGAAARGVRLAGRMPLHQWSRLEAWSSTSDPTVVTSMSIFVEGDDNPVKTSPRSTSPTTSRSTQTGVLLTEDPGSSASSSRPAPPTRATTARLWYVPFDGSEPQVVVKVDQSADGGPTDVDGRAPGNWGAWESSGIVDASAAFGPGAFLLNVQAHTLWIEKAPGDGQQRRWPAGLHVQA